MVSKRGKNNIDNVTQITSRLLFSKTILNGFLSLFFSFCDTHLGPRLQRNPRTKPTVGVLIYKVRF